jgi:uncharacterized membrane protein
MHHQAAAQLEYSDRSTLGGAGTFGLFLAGAGLALAGLRRNDLPGVAMALAGGAVLLGGTRFLNETLAVGNPVRHSKSAVIPAREGIRVEESIVVDRPVALVFRFWRNMENLPIFMHHLLSVRTTGADRSHWVARGPAGTKIEWDAQIINEEEDELIAWKSASGSVVENAGSVHFEALNDGAATRVHVNMKYDPPAGKLGAVIARLFGEEPGQQIHEDLQRFKRLMESKQFSKEELDVLQRRSHRLSPLPPGAH